MCEKNPITFEQECTCEHTFLLACISDYIFIRTQNSMVHDKDCDKKLTLDLSVPFFREKYCHADV